MATILERRYEHLSQSDQRFRDWIVKTKERLSTKIPAAEKKMMEIIVGLQDDLAKPDRKMFEFERQKPFVIADFFVFFADIYFQRHRLAIEVDGRSHLSKAARDKDEWRTGLIAKDPRFTMVRITNDEVLKRDWRITEDWIVKSVAAKMTSDRSAILAKEYDEMRFRHPEVY